MQLFSCFVMASLVFSLFMKSVQFLLVLLESSFFLGGYQLVFKLRGLKLSFVICSFLLNLLVMVLNLDGYLWSRLIHIALLNFNLFLIQMPQISLCVRNVLTNFLLILIQNMIRMDISYSSLLHVWSILLVNSPLVCFFGKFLTVIVIKTNIIIICLKSNRRRWFLNIINLWSTI